MIKEAIDRVLQLSKPNLETINDLVYADRQLILVRTPEPEQYAVSTLSGLIMLLESTDFDPASAFLKVNSLSHVSLVGRGRDEWRRIPCYANAKLDSELKQFPFDSFIDHEKFVIGLLSQFVSEGDLASVVDLASKLTEETTAETTDDGFGQKATMKAGVHLKAERTIKSRVTLTPFRTFREVEQPASDFIFRVRPGGMCALYEADGGQWRVAAMRNLATWLTNALRGSAVVSLNDLPVVI
jgi:inactivated superfamily I helicase